MGLVLAVTASPAAGVFTGQPICQIPLVAQDLPFSTALSIFFWCAGNDLNRKQADIDGQDDSAITIRCTLCPDITFHVVHQIVGEITFS